MWFQSKLPVLNYILFYKAVLKNCCTVSSEKFDLDSAIFILPVCRLCQCPEKCILKYSPILPNSPKLSVFKGKYSVLGVVSCKKQLKENRFKQWLKSMQMLDNIYVNEMVNLKTASVMISGDL